MTKPFTKLAILTILLGVIMLSINIVFGMNTVTYISKIQINGIYMYKVDWFGYVENVRTAFTNYPELVITFPQREWQWPTNWLDIPTNWNILLNDLAYIQNLITLAINASFFPLRVGFYAIRSVLALLGIPVLNYEGNPLEWLIFTCDMMINRFQIPYI